MEVEDARGVLGLLGVADELEARVVEGSFTIVIAESIDSGAATQIRIGIPTASRSSSENITFVGSATATRMEPSSRKRTGSAR